MRLLGVALAVGILGLFGAGTFLAQGQGPVGSSDPNVHTSVDPDTGITTEFDAHNGQYSVVDKDGTVCAVTFSGKEYSDQWLGSRVISAQKANTANAFSLDGLALSTANIYSPVQPGGRVLVGGGFGGLDGTGVGRGQQRPTSAMSVEADAEASIPLIIEEVKKQMTGDQKNRIADRKAKRTGPAPAAGAAPRSTGPCRPARAPSRSHRAGARRGLPFGNGGPRQIHR